MKGFLKELEVNILPFWLDKMPDYENGGFYGRIDGSGEVHRTANKVAVLNCRILWTFSAAYRVLNDPRHLAMAERAYVYIRDKFIDPEFGGVYWELDYKGNPVDMKKQTYAQGFALYGFSEFYRATGNPEAWELSKDFFRLIEKYRDTRYGGYCETFGRDWQPANDMRLSKKDMNVAKSMNTHLHILEPYTNLLRIWSDESLKRAQRELLDIFTAKILDGRTGHLNLFFDEDWSLRSDAVSYGHDIESTWLMHEAAAVLKDDKLAEITNRYALKAAAAASRGLLPDGSMAYETEGSHTDTERHWWVQAEAVVGFMYAWRMGGGALYREKAEAVWKYIRANISDRDGEWYWSVLPDGTPNVLQDKAGPWKCPYHNARMCLEMIENFGFKD